MGGLVGRAEGDLAHASHHPLIPAPVLVPETQEEGVPLGLDASDACLEQLAYCSEEDLYQDWMDREPESPFLLDGAVNPVWTAWLLEEVHRRLGSRVPRSEVERWLAYMVFETSETHRALKARFAAD